MLVPGKNSIFCQKQKQLYCEFVFKEQYMVDPLFIDIY